MNLKCIFGCAASATLFLFHPGTALQAHPLLVEVHKAAYCVMVAFQRTAPCIRTAASPPVCRLPSKLSWRKQTNSSRYCALSIAASKGPESFSCSIVSVSVDVQLPGSCMGFLEGSCFLGERVCGCGRGGGGARLHFLVAPLMCCSKAMSAAS